MTESIASFIDHTLLKPEATLSDIEKLCQEAKDFHFFAVCVNPRWTQSARDCLQESLVKVCTVVGFPLGAVPTKTKVYETQLAIHDGAEEIDMVISIGDLRSHRAEDVLSDIRAVVDAAEGKVVKVILETCLLSEDEKKRGAQLSMEAGSAFVKTSTGFSKGGATENDVRLLREIVGPHKGVKASGGIRDFATAQRMIAAGANRLGTSQSIAILESQRLTQKN